MKKTKLVIITFLMAVITMLFSGCVAKIGVPEVKEGRFDFSLTYEVNGEVKTCTGVYVCVYEGVITTCAGSSLQWRDYIEGEEEMDAPIQTNEDGIVYINFGFFPDYFMNTPDAISYEAPSPNLFMVYNDGEYITNNDEDIAKYGVKIISYQYAAPIENTFKEKLTFSDFVLSIN